MKITKLNNYDIKDIQIKNTELPPQFPPNLMDTYFRCICIGHSGSGKTLAILNLIQHLQPYLNNIYTISPTIHNDAKQIQVLSSYPNSVIFDEPSEEVLNEIIKNIKNNNDDYYEYRDILELWKKFKKHDYNPDKLTPPELLKLYEINFNPKSHPGYSDKKLSHVIFLDDLQGIDGILRGKTLPAFTVKARHRMTSLILNLQSLKGASPVIRRNCSLWLIFKSNDENQLKDIFQEVSGMFNGDYNKFLEAYNYATKNRFNFLYIDMNNYKTGIRKNFNEIINF